MLAVGESRGREEADLARALGEFLRVGVVIAEESCAVLGVSLGQYQALAAIAELQPLSLGALAHELDITAPSATRMCDRLERGALITRTRSARDPRSVDLCVTDEGRRLAEGVRAERRRRVAEMIDRLPEGSVPDIVAALDSVTTALGHRGGPTKALGWG
jgi:DNA-binding MarR family transcriptional regulator